MNVKNKSAARHITMIENGALLYPIALSGEFLPGGANFPGLVAQFLSLNTKYRKKKFFSKKEKNSLEHLILQGYLISNILPGRKKNKYFPGIPAIGIEIA